MAKTLVLILSLFLTVQAFFNIPDDTVTQMETDCLNQNGLDYDTFQQYLANEIPYNDDLGASALCFGKALGIFDDQAEYMRDAVVQSLEADGKDSGEADTLADQCNIQKDSPEATADATVLCLLDNDP